MGVLDILECMNTVSRTITGVLLGLLGAAIAISSYLDRSEDWPWSIAMGVLFIGLGVYIFFNKKEDDIEEIKE